MALRYSFEKIQDGEHVGYQVRIKGQFICYSDSKEPRKVDEYLKGAGTTREEAYRESIEKTKLSIREIADTGAWEEVTNFRKITDKEGTVIIIEGRSKHIPDEYEEIAEVFKNSDMLTAEVFYVNDTARIDRKAQEAIFEAVNMLGKK
jgi:hypothetical protein